MVRAGYDNGVTERRKGLHELVYQIECMRKEFISVRDEIEGRVAELEVWRNVAQPIVQLMVRTMWVVSGASIVLAAATAIVLWVWLQDHALLSEVSKLVITNNTIIERLEKDVEKLQPPMRNRWRD